MTALTLPVSRSPERHYRRSTARQIAHMRRHPERFSFAPKRGSADWRRDRRRNARAWL